jgi:hypothetical protein
MATNAPFTVLGNTVVITAANPAPAPVQVVSTTLGGNQYRIINAGTNTVFLGFGSSAAQATSGALPPSTTLSNCLPILPGTDEIITFVPNAYFTGNASASTALYITPGDGQ